MPFVDDLERELHRAATARERKRKPSRRPARFTLLAPATALAAVIVAAVLVMSSAPPEEERAARDGRRAEVPRLVGSHTTTVRGGQWDGRWELFVRDRSARLLGVIDGTAMSFAAGQLTYRGDEVTFRVDLARTGGDMWPEPICARQRRDTPGTYRIVERAGGSFELRRLRDPCRGRATILTAGVWRRAAG